MSPDLLNALFEATGAAFMVPNVRRLLRDQSIRGVYWPAQIFFTSWGVWNLYFYPAVGQPLSFAAGAVLALANGIWVILAIKYRKN